MSGPHIPPKCLIVDTYDQLREIVVTMRRDVGFLLLIGPPGIGKSEIVEQTLSDTATFVRGAATGYGLYRHLINIKDEPIIVLDDLDGLLADPKTWSLLKSLTESKATKTVSWMSMAPERDKIESSFTTAARTVLIVNCWPAHNQHAAALADRALVVDFRPTPLQVHAEAGRWFQSRSPEIYDYIGNCLSLIVELSFRTYLIAQQLKTAGGDLWKEFIRTSFVDGTLAEVAELLEDTRRFKTDTERIAAFSGSPATFKRAKSKLRSAGLLALTRELHNRTAEPTVKLPMHG